MRQVLLQSGTAFFLIQSAMVCNYKVQHVFHYKVQQLFHYKVRQVLLQSATGITKCDDYYKVRQNKLHYTPVPAFSQTNLLLDQTSPE